MKSRMVDVNSFCHRQFHHRHRFQSAWSVDRPPYSRLVVSLVCSHRLTATYAISSTDTVKRPSFIPLVGMWERGYQTCWKRGRPAPVVDSHWNQTSLGGTLFVVGVGQDRCAFGHEKLPYCPKNKSYKNWLCDADATSNAASAIQLANSCVQL